jgi:hypothetical protein
MWAGYLEGLPSLLWDVFRGDGEVHQLPRQDSWSGLNKNTAYSVTPGWIQDMAALVEKDRASTIIF